MENVDLKSLYSPVKFFDEEKSEEKVYEPYSWSWLALKLAEGAVAWVGGQIIASIFSSGRDIEALMQQYIAEIRQIVHRAIQDNELRSLSSKLDQVQTDFYSYLQAPTGRDRLESATQNISEAKHQLKSFGLVGHASYLVAVNIELAILQERIKVYGDAEKNVMKIVLKRAIAHAESMHREWKPFHDSRYRNEKISHGHDGTDPNIDWECKIWRDGRLIKNTAHNPPECDSLMIQIKNNEWPGLYAQNVEPSKAVVSQWKKLLGSI